MQLGAERGDVFEEAEACVENAHGLTRHEGGLHAAGAECGGVDHDELLAVVDELLGFRGLHERIGQLQQHHTQRCTALEAACMTQAKSAAELLPALFDRDISDPHQLQFAMGETSAHLNYLEQRQRIRRFDDGCTLRYRALS